MTTEQTTDPTPGLERRHFLRGGAVLAGAAGVAALGAALTPATAHAADGDALTLGAANTSSSGTALTIGGTVGSASPALALTNANGPALSLVGPDIDDIDDLELQPGEIAGSTVGPLVGTDEGTTYLVTGFDLDYLPLPLPTEPVRLLDTRTAAGRENIIGRSSAGAVNAQGQLTAGSYIDVAIYPVGVGVDFSAVFINLTATRTSKAGYLVAYPSASARPNTSTLNFDAGATIANGAFVATGEVAGAFAVRIFASQNASVLLDVTGLIASRGDDSSVSSKVGARQAARRSRVLRKPLGRRLGR